jgi:DNA-binding MarR family transcriptional regulator
MGHPALTLPPREKSNSLPPIFIHSCIDDLDLSLEAFRVYSHLSRRWGDGTHDSVGSYSKIGEHCFRASFPCASKATLKRKAIAAIKELEENGLIEKHKHQGYDGRDISNSYTLRTRDELSNVIPFPHPSVATHPPVQYHPIEGTTTQGSTTKGAHSASKNFSENPRADIQPAVTETLTSSSESNDSSATSESEQAKNFPEVDEKVNSTTADQVIDLQQRRGLKEKAPFDSFTEMNEFRQALTEFAKTTGKRNPGGFAQAIVKEMEGTGYEHPYWKEWKNGSAIGTHEKREWEALPGQPYPYFLEYLTGELKRNEYTQAQAVQQANWICSNPQHAKPHWEKFKLKVQREAEEKSRLAQNNITYLSPKWARSETVSFEEAVTAVDQIQGSEPKSPQLQPSETSQDSQADDWINPVASVQDWLIDIEMKWMGIYRGVSQRFFCSAIAHSTLDEQTQIYKLLLNNSFTKEWTKTLIEQEMNYDF